MAVPLAVSGYVHYDLAQGPLAGDGGVTLAGLFVGQAVVAVLVSGWVLLRGDAWSVLVAGAVGLGSLAALVLSTYVSVPAVGPLPAMYEPLWYGRKVAAAVAAALAAAFAAFALLRTRRG